MKSTISCIRAPHIRLDVDRLGQQRRVRVNAPHPLARGVHEYPRERVIDQRILALGLGGAGCRHTQRGGSHALSDLPGIVVGTRHRHFPSSRIVSFANYSSSRRALRAARRRVPYAFSQKVHRLSTGCRGAL